MASIGIIGAGISGLHLALFLQRQGIDTTIYTDRTPAEMRAERLQNNVCRFGRARARERELGVDHWDDPDFAMFCAHVRVHIDPPIEFRGDLSHPGSFVDFRVYLPQLLEDYAARGGRVEQLDDVAPAAEHHDLLVCAVGARSLRDLFPRIADRSADEPARLLLAGLFVGMDDTSPLGLHFDIVPGAGELFQSPVLTFGGHVAGLLIEAVPGGPWDRLVRTSWYDDPRGCADAVVDILAMADSEMLARVDRSTFGLTRSLDLLQGALTPTVRRPWAALENGRFAVAVGDAAVLNDPLTGQGANLGSAAAWALGELIVAAPRFDERFCLQWERRLDAEARPVTNWTNAMLAPPPEHGIRLLRAAAEDQAVADAFLDRFDDPARMWATMATPEGVETFLEEVEMDRLYS